MLKTFDEMRDDETICDYCSATNYGECKSCVTPSGYQSCEGLWCREAYDNYLDSENTTENIVKFASKVKIINKEDFDGQ